MVNGLFFFFFLYQRYYFFPIFGGNSIKPKTMSKYYLPDSEDFFEPDQHNVSFLNEIIESGHIGSFIRLCEALQEKRLSRIAEDIARRKDVRVVLLAGPSSSGKTSTARRLTVQLLTCRKWPVALSMDNWFVNREDTPLDEQGKPDFESLYSLDLKQFNQDLNDLIEGREIKLPTYNFQVGRREYRGDTLQLRPGMMIIIEGIHALNPILTEHLAEKYKYRVYAEPGNCLTIPLADGSQTELTPYDNRLLRRITRDYQTRGCTAARTLSLWDNVRRGEEKWIYPFKGLANATFNTAMLYELSAIRPKVEAMLQEVPADDPGYAEAQRLLSCLTAFTPIPHNEIPMNSLLREFIGGSVFDVG